MKTLSQIYQIVKLFLWGSEGSMLFKFSFPFSCKSCEVFQGDLAWVLCFFYHFELSPQVIDMKMLAV